MNGETVITTVGNLTADPELRYTQQGVPVCNFTVASTPRTFDRTRNEFVDGDALFLRCAVWREAAENVAASLAKGSRVIVTGRLRQRSYQDREGQNRTSLELEVEEVGPSLRWATATIQRTGTATAPRAQPRATEEWHTPSGEGDAWSTTGGPGYADDTPF